MQNQRKIVFFTLAIIVAGFSIYSLRPEPKIETTSFGSSEGESISKAVKERMLKQIDTFRADDAKCDKLYKKGKGLGYRFERQTDVLLKDKTVAGTLLEVDRTGSTKMRILDNGLASLWSRLDLIRNAKKSIEIEYFIYRIRGKHSFGAVTSIKSFFKRKSYSYNNKSTILITQALMRKALEGVKVRVLLDGTVSFKEDIYLAAHLTLKEMAEKAGIDYNSVKGNFIFKRYNKGPILRLSTFNFRNHRKLLVVDDIYAMTGGRNVEDKYFDLDPQYNFHDRDVLVTHEVKGELKPEGLVLAMKKSFDTYWNAKKSKEIRFSSYHSADYYLLGKMKERKFSWFRRMMDKNEAPLELTRYEDDTAKLDTARLLMVSMKKTRSALDILRVGKDALSERIDLANNKKYGRQKRKKFNEEYKGMLQLGDQLYHTQNAINKIGKSNYELTSKKTCNNATYVSDRSVPKGIIRLRLDSFFHGNEYKENFRFTGRLLEEKALQSLNSYSSGSADKSGFEILMSSPYLSLNCRTNKLANKLLASGAKFKVYTNSLYSTDAMYNASLFYVRADKFSDAGVDLYAHNGSEFFPGEEKYPETFDHKGVKKSVLKARWGLHSKSHVFGEDTIYIGTYNMDNRSSFYNAEMGVFCEDTKSLADELRGNIMDRVKNASIHVQSVSQNKGVNLIDDSIVDPHGPVSSKKEIEFMYKIFPLIEKIEFLF